MRNRTSTRWKLSGLASRCRVVVSLLLFLCATAACGDQGDNLEKCDTVDEAYAHDMLDFDETAADTSDSVDQDAGELVGACGNGNLDPGEECDHQLDSWCTTHCAKVRCGSAERPCSDMTCSDSRSCAAGCDNPATCLRAVTELVQWRGVVRSFDVVDVNGDQRLDLLVGHDAEHCAYLNRSTEDGIALEADDSSCVASAASVFMPVKIDKDTTQLIDLQLGRQLQWGSADEGLVEVGSFVPPSPDCILQAHIQLPTIRRGQIHGIALCNSGDIQRWSLIDGNFQMPGTVHSTTGRLASLSRDSFGYALHDTDDDGLSELFVIEDSYSTSKLRNTSLQPGGVCRRSSPLTNFCSMLSLFASNQSAWGSYMGFTPFVIGSTRLIFLSDIGANRAIEFDESTFNTRDRAADLGLDLAYIDNEGLLSAWSAVTIDYNDDGWQDILLAQAWTPVRCPIVNDDRFSCDRDIASEDAHSNVLLLQRDGGFERLVMREGDFHHQNLIPVDWNRDGVLDLVASGIPDESGTEVEFFVDWRDERPRYCSVFPTAAYGQSAHRTLEYFRHGSWRPAGSHVYPHTSSLAPRLVPADTTRIRFASGHEIAVDCSDFVERVVEPRWLRVEVENTGARLVIDTPNQPDSVQVFWTPPSGSSLRSETLTAPYRLPGDIVGEFAVKLNERWIEFVFERPTNVEADSVP